MCTHPRHNLSVLAFFHPGQKNKKGVIAIKETDIHHFPIRYLPFICDKCVLCVRHFSETLAHPLANLPRLFNSQCRFIQHTAVERQKFINVHFET